jgi:hypothetical protein
MTSVMPASAWFASATDEDLQVAEDWFREHGRHEEANRVMAFRRFEPLMRAVAAAQDAAHRIYESNGNSYKTRKPALRKEIDAITGRRYSLENDLDDLIWQVFGTFVASHQRTRAREIGKDVPGDDESDPVEVSDVVF